jgi:hypothetical protein
MPLRLRTAVGATIAAASLTAVGASAGPAAAGPGLVVGAVEDGVRAPTLVQAEAKMTLFRAAGFRSVRVTSLWTPGLSAPDSGELTVLQNVADAAQMNGVRVFVTVMSPGSKTTPLTDDARAQFASYAAAIVRSVPGIHDLIVGNEPNLNRFWLPQYGLDGSDAAAPAYLALLSQTYDSVKAANPDVVVYGGAVSPRGSDDPKAARQTHSPTTFIRDLGAAYRASGRDRPIMDALDIHPYGDSSSQPPTTAHPLTTSIGIADYTKLVTLLGQAFDGTAQPGSTLPILYGEYGVETQIPAAKSSLYTGTEPTTTKPTTEATQAAYYEQALAMAFCQPNVIGFLVFHAIDETALPAWQSGVYYADGTPKSSLPRVREALDKTVGGSITRCPGVQLVVHPTVLRFGTRSAAKRGIFRIALECDLDCAYQVRLEKLPTHSTRLVARGVAPVDELVHVDLPSRRLGPGTYRYTLRLVQPVNPAPPTLRQSPPFALP